MGTTNILDLNNRIDELEKNSGGGGSADSAKRSDIATEFSTETSYTAGNFVYYEGKLYQFNADHTAGAWVPTDVMEANVTDQIESNASAIAGLTASDIMMSDGETSVEDAISDVDTYSLALTGFDSPITLQRVGRVVYVTYNGNVSNLPAGTLSFSTVVPEKYRPAETTQFFSVSTAASYIPPVMLRFNRQGAIDGYNYRSAITSSAPCRFNTIAYVANS